METAQIDLEQHRTTLLGRARLLKFLWDWPSEVEIEDVVSTALIRAWEHRDSFRGKSRGELLNWLFTILNSEVVDALRKVGAEKRGGGRVRNFEEFISESQSRFESLFAADLSTVSSALQKQEMLQAAYAAIELLPDRQRTVLLARFIGEWSLDEIAADLNRTNPSSDPVTPKAVSSLIHRALTKLRGFLKQMQ